MKEIQKNPWKGLDYYTEEDSFHFFGRGEDTKRLAEVVNNSLFTVMYGLSGVGKSSLLNAGLKPLLEKKNFFFIYVRTIDFSAGYDNVICQIINAIYSEAEKQQVELSPLNNLESNVNSLWYQLHGFEYWSSDNQLLTPFLVFDQFEEIFTHSSSEEDIFHFFNEIDCLASRDIPLQIIECSEKLTESDFTSNFRVLFCLREDFLPRLDDYVYSIGISALKKARLSISLMDLEQAREVILSPCPLIIGETEASAILDILSSDTVGGLRYRRIEPFLLSLFMYRIYEKMGEMGLEAITTKLINNFGKDIVKDFYKESVSKVSEKAIKYLENSLLTSNGFRDSIAVSRVFEDGEVSSKELDTLIRTRIIKKYSFNGVDRIEFTHDVLGKHALDYKNERLRNNNARNIYGFCFESILILLAVFVGVIMNEYISNLLLPLLLVGSTFSLSTIFGFRINKLKTIVPDILALFVLGIVMISSHYGFLNFYKWAFFSIFACLSLYFTYRFISHGSSCVKKLVPVSLAVWIASSVIIPFLAYGYNPFAGFNLSRDKQIVDEYFYVKNKEGLLGVRDRFRLVQEPLYSDYFEKWESGYIVKSNGKYSLLDSLFSETQKISYDSLSIEDGALYWYHDGCEVFENGLLAKWSSDITPEQKNAARKIISGMVLVEGGTFNMGAKDGKEHLGENLVHKVTLSGFYINKYETTIEDWIQIMNYNPLPLKSEFLSLKCPVQSLQYDKCLNYLKKLSDLTGLRFDFPTEAQWEFAARGGGKSHGYTYSGGNIVTDCGWIMDNSENRLHEVGQKKANELGLYDMTGNVGEWCKDYMSLDAYKQGNEVSDPCIKKSDLSPNFKNKRVYRGGSYNTSSADNSRNTARQFTSPNYIYENIGFRVVVN